MPNDTAAEKAGSAENRDNTIARGCHGSSVPTSVSIGRAIRGTPNILSILLAMIKSFSCSPLIFFVRSEMVA
jgi:hypothetical protein